MPTPIATPLAANRLAPPSPLFDPRAGGLRPWAWILLTLYSASLFLFQLGSARTFSAHESFIAQISREMIDTGDWLVPRIGGHPWLEKPPLPYWIVAVLGTVLGQVDELTARLPSALAGVIGTLLLAAMIARWFGPSMGLLTGLVQTTTIYTVTYARLAEMDIYLWTLVLGCITLVARRVQAPADAAPRNGERFAFFILLGLTQLCKGPLFGAAMVLLPCAGFILWNRDRRLLRWLIYWPGILACLLIAGAWPAAILLRYPEAGELWWVHTFGRFGSERCINPEPLWYYFATVPWQMLPWTPALIAGVATSWRRATHYRMAADRFLWVWLLVPLFVLSLAQAKHHHYLIYALPPCSAWAAEGLVRARSLFTYVLTRASLRWGLLATAIAVLVGIGFGVKAKYPEHFICALILVGIYAAGTSMAAALCAWRNYRAAAVVLFASLWGMFAYVHLAVLSRFDSYAPETAFMQRLEREHDADDPPILVYGTYPLGEHAEIPQPGSETFERINPARVLLYLPKRTELVCRPADLEKRGAEHPDALIVSTIGFEEDLRKMGEPTRIDQMAKPRKAQWGVYSQFAVYRMKWKTAPDGQAGIGEVTQRP